MQQNSRIGLEALSDIVSLSVPSVQRRLKQLRDNKIIEKDVSIIDPAKVGQPMTFIIMIELEKEHPEQIDIFTNTVLSDTQVQQCYYITGEADFCLICTARDMNDFEALTHRLFFLNKNVRRFRTSVVMGRRKVSLCVNVNANMKQNK